VTTSTVQIGSVLLTRVSYAEVEVEPAVVSLTADEVAAAPWAEPTWASGKQVRASASAWIIESGDARIVVDPAQAVDFILRTDDDAAAHQEAFAALLEAAGFPRESFTHAIATHLDGIGMFAWRHDDGTWTRFFPNAPILMSQRELDGIEHGYFVPSGKEVLAELRAQGAVQALTRDHERVADDVSVEFTGAHSEGHQVVRVSSNGEEAVMIGHLALSPLQFAQADDQNHFDPDGVMAIRRKLLAEDAVLIGPLWPAPGAGRWDGSQLIPVAR
jgi:glyoxylase-like metal-dependent hydrolase (beta-lactamase superfamily II)